jgi:Xaa-Pro aminopeptidase
MRFIVLIVLAFSSSFIDGADEHRCIPLPTQKDTSSILSKLRDEMQKEGIGVYVIFPDDEHASEYTQPYDKRRDWISGFRGSAGITVVSLTDAALWTDSRYYTQAEEQLDCNNWLLMRDGSSGVPALIDWFVSQANLTNLVRFRLFNNESDQLMIDSMSFFKS